MGIWQQFPMTYRSIECFSRIVKHGYFDTNYVVYLNKFLFLSSNMNNKTKCYCRDKIYQITQIVYCIFI